MEKALQDILYLVITVLVPVGIKYLVTYLNTKTKEMNVKIENDNVKLLLENASNLVESVVLEVSQTYVDTVKKDGDWNEITKQKAFDGAKQKAINMLSLEAIDVIENTYTSLDDYMKTMIEATVKKLEMKIK